MAEKKIPLSNGDTVILDDNRRSLVLNMDDLYKYRLVDDSSEIVRGKGSYVANEGDLIWSFAMRRLFQAGRVDTTDYHVDLTFWETEGNDDSVSIEDKLLGVGPGYTSESYRLYLDTTVFPYGLDVNSRLHAYGSKAKEIRIFMGVNTSSTGEVISAMYNQSGDIVSDAIPLEVVQTEFFNNIATKAPVKGYTTKNMVDGELVTIVVYNYDGAVTDQFKVLVQNTNAVRRPSEAMKRVKSIELISDRLSSTEPNTLVVPINLTVASLQLRAKVTYVDGGSFVMDVVDETANGKFKLLGLIYWSPTIIGEEQELTLTYSLSKNEEFSYLQGQTFNGAVTQSYKIRGDVVEPAYSLKLYAFPSWVNSQQGYQLEYWLCDLTRQITRLVPKAAVSLATDSAPFDGLDFTSTQHIKFGVDLSVVDVSYGDHVHVQQSQIALLRDGGQRASNWKVKFAANQTVWYGDTLSALVKASGGGLSTVNVGNSLADQTAWLEKLFYATSPLYDTQTEQRAPLPTHFYLRTKTRSTLVPISQWKNDITFINDLAEGQTIYLEWIRRLAGGDLHLGISGLPIHQV